MRERHDAVRDERQCRAVFRYGRAGVAGIFVCAGKLEASPGIVRPRGGQGTYKSGASRLAVATGTPIVPIAVSSAKCWPRKSFLLRPGVIDISIGRPIPSAGRDPDDLMREVERWIEAEMRRLDPAAYAGESARPAAS